MALAPRNPPDSARTVSVPGAPGVPATIASARPPKASRPGEGNGVMSVASPRLGRAELDGVLPIAGARAKATGFVKNAAITIAILIALTGACMGFCLMCWVKTGPRAWWL